MGKENKPHVKGDIVEKKNSAGIAPNQNHVIAKRVNPLGLEGAVLAPAVAKDQDVSRVPLVLKEDLKIRRKLILAAPVSIDVLDAILPSYPEVKLANLLENVLLDHLRRLDPKKYEELLQKLAEGGKQS